MVHTPYGQDVLKRFLGDVCGADMTWSAASIIDEQIERIRTQVGDGKVVCGLSGGRGLQRRRAARAPRDRRPAHLRLRRPRPDAQERGRAGRRRLPRPVQGAVVHVQAEERFLARLAGVTDPEAKRKAIGAEFIRVFEEEAAKLGDANYLVQGTLYSDVIESGGGTGAATIKSHHNVGGLPEDLQFELVEPLRALFKDEVRAVGTSWGSPRSSCGASRSPARAGDPHRRRRGDQGAPRPPARRRLHPPGRIRAAGLYRDLWQSFCVLPDIRTVGVQGDERTYGYVVSSGRSRPTTR